VKIFWSWQSDTPGKTGRHFVRDAILGAIEDLKTPPDVEEPTQRVDREVIHLDSDRQGVAGSPDLAATIFAKIDSAAVIIADVTPVGIGPARKDEDGNQLPPKALMNPNVAIELGYALAKPGEGSGNNLLMVFNGHYGTRSDLPFDLAHKAGPIFYTLPPEAPRAIMEAEGKKLRRQLVTALRPFLEFTGTKPVPSFVSTLSGANAGVWFQREDRLGQSGGSRFDRTLTDHIMPVSPVFYLRLIPSAPLARPVSRSQLRDFAHHLPFFSMTGGSFIRENRWGAVNMEPQGGSAPPASGVQLFLSGELWAVNHALLARFESEGFFPYVPVETILRTRLPQLLDVLLGRVGVLLPITAEVGFVGVKDLRMAVSETEALGPVHSDPRPARAQLNIDTPAAQRQLLLTLFEAIFFELVQEHRPKNYRGFPE